MSVKETLTVIVTQKKPSRQYVKNATISCLLDSPQGRLYSNADTG